MLPTSQMTESLIRKPYTGAGAYGPVYGAVEDIVGVYVEQTTKRLTNQFGQEVIANLFCILKPGATIAVGDEITYGTTRYEVVQADPFRMTGAAHHTEVYLKTMGPALLLDI